MGLFGGVLPMKSSALVEGAKCGKKVFHTLAACGRFRVVSQFLTTHQYKKVSTIL